MAVYRNIQLSFWTDNKVEDDFTPEDKYFYLYLLTNPQTNICGCYEVSYNQMCNQTGYNKDTINRLLDRFENTHKMIKYSKKTKEVLILNWHKYNWTKSEKVLTGVETVAKHIKCAEFRNHIFNTVKMIKNNTVSIGYQYPMETSVSDTDSVIYINNNNIDINKDIDINNNIDININNKLNEKEELEKNFKIIYDSYPKKVGKTAGYELYKQWIKGRDILGNKIKLTNRQIWSAIARYKKQIEEDGTEKQYIKQFDTFMRKPILDYIESEGKK